jgi:hypothetical protein
MAKNRTTKGQGRLIPVATEPPDEEARQNGSIIRNLQETLENEETFSLFPTWLVNILEGEKWRRFSLPVMDELVTWDNFEAFVKARRPRGLGIQEGTKKLYAECRFYADQGNEKAASALRLIQELTPAEAKHGTNQHSPDQKSGPDGIRSNSEYGTSETYLLRRLKRDRPDLAERVIKRELSPRAAAIEAGWPYRMVQHPPTVDGFARAIRKHLSEAERSELKEQL